MSVLIKDMEMPKDCPYCKMAYYNASDEFTGCAVVPNKRYAMHNDKAYAQSTQRPDWCPLVEMPAPHDDLIDRNAFVELLDKEYRPTYGVKIFKSLLNARPTVIKAEGTNEGSN